MKALDMLNGHTDVSDGVAQSTPSRERVVNPAKRAAGQAVRRRRMTQSAELFTAVQNRRKREQVLVSGVKMAPSVVLIQPEEFTRLNIDESYQRARISKKVNDLISVLLSGGQIPDPIDVVERTDGSWWIVDGQQRFWAHVEAARPIKAHIHHVDDHDAEVRLFYALNSRYSLTTKNVVKGWPGLTGEFIRRMDTSERSPLRGMIDFGGNSKRPVDANALVQALMVLLTGTSWRGDTMTSMLPRVDTALRLTGAVAWAEAYVQLLAAVFGPRHERTYGKVRILPMLALATVARRKYIEAGRPVFPRSCRYLQKVNWVTAVPSHARKYLPELEHRMERLWK